MNKVPFEQKYQGVLIRVESIAISDIFWEMNSSENITGTSLSKLWLHHAQQTNLLGEGSITANITLILRNQSDYSNVIVILGTYSVIANPIEVEKSHERMLLLLSEFIYELAKEYIVETNLTGKDKNGFIIPDFNYTDEFFKLELDWSFR